MPAALDLDAMTKLQVAVAVHCADGADVETVREAEARCLQSVEARRRYESWRLDTALTIELDGFTRGDDRIELRGRLLPDAPDCGCIVGQDEEGRAIWWPGPGTPRPT